GRSGHLFIIPRAAAAGENVSGRSPATWREALAALRLGEREPVDDHLSVPAVLRVRTTVEPEVDVHMFRARLWDVGAAVRPGRRLRGRACECHGVRRQSNDCVEGATAGCLTRWRFLRWK